MQTNKTKPTVVITDWTFENLDFEKEFFSSKQITLIGRQCKTEADLVALVAKADAVITQFAKLSAPVINAMTMARAIVRYGIGVDNVDVQAARLKNIPVCNVPDYCIEEVADHTLAFILASTRQVVPNSLYLHQGNWGLPVPLDTMRTLQTLTVGLIGFGRIGRAVASRLKPFKCRVLVFDPGVAATEIDKTGAKAVSSLQDLLKQSDIVSPHCPLSEATRQMFNAQTFAMMKRGAIFINLGRGDLMDCNALVAALQSGQLGAAALDVFSPEPIPADSPVRKLANVILSPHVASTSPQSGNRLRETAAQIAVLAVSGKTVPNIVNGVQPSVKRAKATQSLIQPLAGA
jgi:D-3-phosphoglycerate dehydrogenase